MYFTIINKYKYGTKHCTTQKKIKINLTHYASGKHGCRLLVSPSETALICRICILDKQHVTITLEILFHWNRCVVWHCIETCIPSLEWFGPTVTKLCSGQRNPDDTDESNPYMSPFQATQKLSINTMVVIWSPKNPCYSD